MGFLTRYDEDLREPLVQCQVSQVSMRVKRGRVSWCIFFLEGSWLVVDVRFKFILQLWMDVRTPGEP